MQHTQTDYEHIERLSVLPVSLRDSVPTPYRLMELLYTPTDSACSVHAVVACTHTTGLWLQHQGYEVCVKRICKQRRELRVPLTR